MADKENKGDSRNRKTRLIQERQEEMRKLLQGKGLLQQVFVTLDKLDNEYPTLTSTEIGAMKVTLDTRMKLVNKLLPDAKEQQEQVDQGTQLSEAIMAAIARLPN